MKELCEAHIKGGLNELTAACWFIGEGYQVYWPHVKQGAVDFIAETSGKLIRVQVKGAFWNKNSGRYMYLQCRTRTTSPYFQHQPTDGNYDLFVPVFGDEIWVIPADKITSSNISLRSTSPNYRGSEWDVYKVK